jgi:hypothetical protein
VCLIGATVQYEICPPLGENKSRYKFTFLAGVPGTFGRVRILIVYTGPCKKSKLRPRFIFPEDGWMVPPPIPVGTKSVHRTGNGGSGEINRGRN